MSTTTTATATTTGTGGDVVSILHIGPRGLDHYLKAVEGQASNPLLKCDGRRIILVSPGSVHECAAEQLHLMIMAVIEALRIPSRCYGSTLYRHPGGKKGVMPDKSYYLQNVDQVRKLRVIDLRVCPPPDLVIEVADSHPPRDSLKVCLALGVPEVWVYDVPVRKLDVLLLGQSAKGRPRYVAGERSRAFPFLLPDEIAPWADPTEENDGDFSRRARAWAEADLAPRLRAGRDDETV